MPDTENSRHVLWDSSVGTMEDYYLHNPHVLKKVMGWSEEEFNRFTQWDDEAIAARRDAALDAAERHVKAEYNKVQKLLDKDIGMPIIAVGPVQRIGLPRYEVLGSNLTDIAEFARGMAAKCRVQICVEQGNIKVYTDKHLTEKRTACFVCKGITDYLSLRRLTDALDFETKVKTENDCARVSNEIFHVESRHSKKLGVFVEIPQDA